MHLLLNLLYIPLIPFLDRWGGGGFEFLTPRIPDLLKRGIKAVRRFGIPISLLLLSPTPEGVVGAICLCVFFHLPLRESSDGLVEFYGEAAVFALALLIGMFPFAGLFCVIPYLTWMFGLYLSNSGIGGRKLAWQYAELLRGLSIAIGALLHAII